MAIQSMQTIAAIVIPDTELVREATEFIRGAEEDVLYHHSRRVFLFGALHGRRLGLQPDPELLYIAAMFHDLGLATRYRASTQRFEIDGADAARDFLLEHGVGQADADKVWLGIALHTTPRCPPASTRKPRCWQPVSRPTWSASAASNSPRRTSPR